MIFHVLVVDDEPFIADSVYHLLSQEENMEVYCAYSAAEALQVFAQMRIDLLISDIRMPEMDGLELLDRVNRCWPQCKCIFLTAYPQFDYLYQAMNQKAAGYLLKTETDAVLLQKVRETLDSFRVNREAADRGAQNSEMLRQRQMMFASVEKESGADSLLPLLRQCGFSLPCPQLVFLLARTAKPLTEKKLVYLNQCLSQQLSIFTQQYTYALNLSDSAALWLCRCPDDEALARLYGLLETVQNTYQLAEATSVDFLVCLQQPEAVRFSPLCEDLLREMESREALSDGVPFVYLFSPSDFPENQGTVENIKAYIAAHVREDLSVATLSAVSHYNSDYLTRLFRQTTGFTLSHYIASYRMDEIRRLMKATRMSLNDIAAHMSFSSRSYFNRFIKRETGMTPQELMMELREEK